MAELTPEGRRIVDEAARRHGMSAGAAQTVLEALVASGGGMAQFNHPDLGGLGQWSPGGMIMIGDMFNNDLKSRVAALCQELSEFVSLRDTASRPIGSSQRQSQGDAGDVALPATDFFVGRQEARRDWWPSELGIPASTGAQNNMRYACFPERRRLVLDVNGQISVYDTGGHRITGFSQQQSGSQSLTFTSQHGSVQLDRLAKISGDIAVPDDAAVPAPEPGSNPGASQPGIFNSIERLAGLRDKGFISEQEFSAKRAELLKRL
jgi:hypothetical protein